MAPYVQFTYFKVIYIPSKHCCSVFHE